MTSRERVEAALQHREPDRTPVFEYVLLAPVAEQLIGRPFVDCNGGRHGWDTLIAEKGWEGAVRQYARDQVEIAALLGHDLLYVVPNPAPPRIAPPAPPETGGERDGMAPPGPPRNRGGTRWDGFLWLP